MKSTDSCVVTTSANLLLTLDPIQRSRMEWIRLTTNCAYRRWLCEKSRTSSPERGEVSMLSFPTWHRLLLGREGGRPPPLFPRGNTRRVYIFREEVAA